MNMHKEIREWAITICAVAFFGGLAVILLAAVLKVLWYVAFCWKF